MIFLTLAFKSLRNRRLTFALTVLSIALSTALLLSVSRIKRAAEEGFTQSISQTDLIVGARSGPINLLLYSVFNIGSATNNISWETYQHFKNHEVVDWVIPYSLGDGHRGFRVVGTDNSFFEHYHFRGNQGVELRQGHNLQGLWDVVLGAEVAKTLSYKLGDRVVVAHGVTNGEGVLKHDDKPFTVTGIMQATGTALDRSLYITLEGLEGLHLDWQNGAMPKESERISPEQIHKENIKVKTITAFFLRTKSRIDTLRLQREINTYAEEPLLAIIPGVTLSELWRGLGYVEQAFKVISWLVVAVGLVSMLVALLTGLNERRREMSILRALGASSNRIVALLMFESGLLTLVGVIVGFFIQFLVFILLQNWLEREFGLVLQGSSLSFLELFYLLVTFIAGLFIGLLPAMQARSMALKDGLSVRI